MTYEDKKVKLVFQSSDSAAANLKIRLRYDNLTQTEFFTSLLNGRPQHMDDLIKLTPRRARRSEDRADL